MFEMLNLRNLANRILVGIFLFAWAVFAIVLVVHYFRGIEQSKFFDDPAVLMSCIAMGIATGIISMVVAVQDSLAGETSYTATGRIVKSDAFSQTHEIVLKTAFRNESPFTFWFIVFVKAIPGILLILVLFMALKAFLHL